jgi:hypothetical protein
VVPGVCTESLAHPAPNKRLHLTPGSGARWLGTVSVAPAQVKRGVRQQKQIVSMATELISKKTRQEFREWLVGWVLRKIEDLFDNHEVKHINLPPEQLPSGARRSLVECYYASIDWTNPVDVRKILDVYEDILLDIPQADYEKKDAFITLLKRDGYTYEENT